MKPNVVDWIALGLVAVSALAGMRRGLVVTTLSFGGLVAGAYAGSRVAPHLLRGGSGSAWTPLAGLIGAMLGAVLLQALAGIAGSMVRGGFRSPRSASWTRSAASSSARPGVSCSSGS